MSLIIMGLDQSITNSVAVRGFGDARPHVTRISTKPKDFEHKLDRLDHIARAFSSPCVIDGPGVAYVEGYGFGSQVAHSLGELGGMLQLDLWRAGWEIYLVPPSTLKKFVTGKGNAEKSLMMLEVYKRWGYSAHDDNDCDAFALYAFGALHQLHIGGIESTAFGAATKVQAECFSKIEHLQRKGAA